MTSKALSNRHPMRSDSELDRGDLRAARRRGDVALLLNALRDPNWRLDALSYLGGLKAREAVGPVTLLLGSSDSRMRAHAALTLRRIGDPEAVPALIERLRFERERVPRTHVIAALGELGDHRAVEPMCDLLDDDDVVVRAAAARALGRLGDPATLARVEAAAAAERWYHRTEHRKAIRQLRRVTTERKPA